PAAYTLSLHDALPISAACCSASRRISSRLMPNSDKPKPRGLHCAGGGRHGAPTPCNAEQELNMTTFAPQIKVPAIYMRGGTSKGDRKSTRLNSSHVKI